MGIHKLFIIVSIFFYNLLLFANNPTSCESISFSKSILQIKLEESELKIKTTNVNEETRNELYFANKLNDELKLILSFDDIGSINSRSELNTKIIEAEQRYYDLLKIALEPKGNFATESGLTVIDSILQLNDQYKEMQDHEIKISQQIAPNEPTPASNLKKLEEKYFSLINLISEGIAEGPYAPYFPFESKVDFLELLREDKGIQSPAIATASLHLAHLRYANTKLQVYLWFPE